MEIKKIIVGDLETNCYVLESAGEICVIDPGAESDKIEKVLKSISGKLKYIINTHYHFDHVDANEKIKKTCGGEIVIHEKEKEYIDFDPDRTVREGDKIYFGNSELVVLHTPGHSKGSMCLLSGQIIFSGDTIFLNGIGRTDLVGGSVVEMESSLLRLQKIIKSGMAVYPGHGEMYFEK